MKWLENFTLIMRSSITSLREQVEDPERMLHQVIIDMDEELLSIRRKVAEAIADEIQLRKRVEQARTEVTQWHTRAAQAVQRQDAIVAEAALHQKHLADERAQGLATEHAKQLTETTRLQQAVRDLEDKIRQARQKQALLSARLVRAESSTRISQALNNVNSSSAFAQFERLEKRVDRAEALSEAYDRLDGKDPDAEELDRQFQEQTRREKVQAELAALQAQSGAST
ncbi:MAG TPA: PspA/IM30 family protein [Planctomycetaceae bacterium]|jgi:phage shock protein A|nr:PspA/IM30 family protein [Planctomycetaceae bacterium]